MKGPPSIFCSYPLQALSKHGGLPASRVLCQQCVPRCPGKSCSGLLLQKCRHRRTRHRRGTRSQKRAQSFATQRQNGERESLRKQKKYSGATPHPKYHPAACHLFCLVLFLSEFHWGTVASFVMLWSRRNRSLVLSHGDAKAAAHDLFLQIPVEKQHVWMEETLEVPLTAAVKRARRFLLEAKLATFVLNCNNMGFAPTSGQIEVAALAQHPGANESEQDEVYVQAIKLRHHQARARWTAKWHLSHGCMAAGRTPMTVEVLRQKVSEQTKPSKE